MRTHVDPVGWLDLRDLSAHVEGGFGLFSQDAPPLEIRASTSRELAKEILRLRVQAFARTLNHRPRSDRSWRTRIDLYREEVPTEDEVKAARKSLEERMKKIERARATELLRTDPFVMHWLDETFLRLGIIDPERHVRRAISRRVEGHEDFARSPIVIRNDGASSEARVLPRRAEVWSHVERSRCRNGPSRAEPWRGTGVFLFRRCGQAVH